ncbi:hypothetical protein NDU88_010045 [Pleurodeles waltl]|uniref:Uncharacterized protein n=1 Tax=Pleurodeles waltl TaxID=8319 RepID=A0AAV7S056_PLEWA|nr:hypothetical protein NDU88_010045 [Pleurodeles waltl]
MSFILAVLPGHSLHQRGRSLCAYTVLSLDRLGKVARERRVFMVVTALIKRSGGGNHRRGPWLLRQSDEGAGRGASVLGPAQPARRLSTSGAPLVETKGYNPGRQEVTRWPRGCWET